MKLIAIVAGLLILVWVSALVVGIERLDRAERDGWLTPTGSLRDFPRMFPLQRTTPAAERLEELAEPLGIDLVPRSEAMRPWRSRDETTALRAAMLELRDYIASELRQSPHVPAPPPAALASFLTTQNEHLRRAADQLLRDQQIRWTVDVAAGGNAPIPNLLGHMNLHRLLLGTALAHTSRGETAEAWRYVEAATRLADVTLNRPELISQLIGIAQAKTIAGTMRHLGGSPPEWALSWPAADLERGYVAGLTSEAYVPASGSRGDVTPRRALATVRRPYDLIVTARGLTSFKSLIRSVDRARLCSDDPPFRSAWMGMPNVSASWKRLTEAAIHIAGTRRLLAVRSNRPEPASACSAGWATERDSTGTRIRYTRPFTPPPSPSPSPQMPLDFTLPSSG